MGLTELNLRLIVKDRRDESKTEQEQIDELKMKLAALGVYVIRNPVRDPKTPGSTAMVWNRRIRL